MRLPRCTSKETMLVMNPEFCYAEQWLIQWYRLLDGVHRAAVDIWLFTGDSRPIMLYLQKMIVQPDASPYRADDPDHHSGMPAQGATPRELNHLYSGDL